MDAPRIGASSLIKSAKTHAIKKFIKGPAKETSAISFLPSRRLKGSTGTGLAPPRINVPFEPINKINGSRMLMYGSICGFGFNVIRPKSLAVGSPSLSATIPWDTS